MDPKLVRERHELSQIEMSVLMGVSKSNIINWESGRRRVGGSTLTLFKLVDNDDKSELLPLVRVACSQKYVDIKRARAAMRLAQKLVGGVLCGILEMTVSETNPHFSPEELGLKVSS